MQGHLQRGGEAMAGFILATCDCSKLTLRCFEPRYCGVTATVGLGRHYQPHLPRGCRDREGQSDARKPCFVACHTLYLVTAWNNLGGFW